MNRSRDIRSRRILAFMAMVFGAILTTMVLPSYGQQDVDPTWYDPYAVSTLPNPAPHTVAIHSSQAPLSIHQQQTTLTSASLPQGAERLRAKQSMAAPKIRAVSVLGDQKQLGEVLQPARRREQND
jgi:hypothetical protein